MKHDYTMIYDGQCPLCATGARFARVDREQARLRCVDARKDPITCRELKATGMALDDGVVLIRDGHYLQGAEAVHALALAAPRRGLFNRVNRWLFADSERAQRIYPRLLAARNRFLRLLGRQPIDVR